MVTIKILAAARKMLRHICVQTGEKQYMLINRLAAQENGRLNMLEQSSRLPKTKGKWELKFNRESAGIEGEKPKMEPSVEEQRRLDAVDHAEGKRGLVTMVSIKLEEYQMLKRALHEVRDAFERIDKVTPFTDIEPEWWIEFNKADTWAMKALALVAQPINGRER